MNRICIFIDDFTGFSKYFCFIFEMKLKLFVKHDEKATNE